MGIKARLEQLDWPMMAQQFWGFGYAKTPPVLRPGECRALIELYVDKTRFRSRIDMARHRFGEGEYQYFTEPLLALVQDLRQHAYPPLAEIANCWEVVTPEQGAILTFATRYQPMAGGRGYYQVNMRHGVSRVQSGLRYTLGVIFHNAT